MPGAVILTCKLACDTFSQIASTKFGLMHASHNSILLTCITACVSKIKLHRYLTNVSFTKSPYVALTIEHCALEIKTSPLALYQLGDPHVVCDSRNC